MVQALSDGLLADDDYMGDTWKGQETLMMHVSLPSVLGVWKGIMARHGETSCTKENPKLVHHMFYAHHTSTCHISKSIWTTLTVTFCSYTASPNRWTATKRNPEASRFVTRIRGGALNRQSLLGCGVSTDGMGSLRDDLRGLSIS